MLSVPPDEAYLRWLYHQVADAKARSPRRTYWSLFRVLYTKEFIWLIPNDDNRVEDGRDLRNEFLDDHGMTPRDVGRDWMTMGCSFLELLIGLSRRLSFEAEGDAAEWFWHLLEMLELNEYNDARKIPEARVDDILDAVIWRTYQSDGLGGLFPLRMANEDQTEVEIWYQLNAYLLERD